MPHTSTKGMQNYAWLSGKGDLLRIVQEIKIWPFTKWYMQKTKSIIENEIHNILLDFEIQTDPQSRPENQIWY